MITSKITEIKSVKLYDKGKHGPIWYFTMVCENGDTVNIGKKSDDAFQLGDTINYIVEVEEYGVKKVRHPKPEEMPQTDKQAPTHSTPSRTGSQNASFSMSYAKDIVCAGKVDVAELEHLADQILAWLNAN